jgi:succinate dehydrogenase/fumarate reductase flavoprotein subunit
MLQHELQKIMWQQAGPFRTGAKLAAALQRIRHMREHELVDACLGAEKSYNLDILDWFELRAMLVTSEAVVASALARAESRGAHQREDFPESDDALLKNQIVELANGELRSHWMDPVRLPAAGVGGD